MQDRETPLIVSIERRLGRKLTPEEHRLITLTEQTIMKEIRPVERAID